MRLNLLTAHTPTPHNPSPPPSHHRRGGPVNNKVNIHLIPTANPVAISTASWAPSTPRGATPSSRASRATSPRQNGCYFEPFGISEGNAALGASIAANSACNNYALCYADSRTKEN